MKIAAGTPEKPLRLKTPSLKGEFDVYVDQKTDLLVCRVGKTVLSYQLRCIEDLHAMLIEHGDWIALGSADEQKPAKADSVEAWARSKTNPVGGWYGTRKGFRGRFANYVPPVLEKLDLAEVEHNARNNRMRAK